MTQFNASVIENRKVADGYQLLCHTWPESVTPPVPGQFVTIRSGDSTDPLLRRPFAVSSFSHGTGSLVYQIRGKSTRALAACREGDTLDVLGPLGNCFPEPDKSRRPLLVAGGIGFGPVYFFARNLIDRGLSPMAIVGARTAGLIPDVQYPTGSDGVRIFSFATDDGSRGLCGTALDAVRGQCGTKPENYEIFACGPEPMLRALADFASSTNVPCWISMEQTMGCAVGACMGCVIRIKGPNPYARVCTEGPVFSAGEIQW